MPHQFFKLFAHMRWADESVLQALRAAEDVPPDALRLYAHVLGAEHVWLARINRQAAEVAIWPRLLPDECAALAGENHSAYEHLLARLSPDELAQNVRYQNSTGAEFDTSVEDILLHVALHGSYHRGQIARALREGGGVPQPTDYIAFVRGAAAGTRPAS